MKKIILINIVAIFVFLGCSSSSVDYLPAVVFVKQPEILSIDGNNKTYVEFAVSDLNELEGQVELEILDASKAVLASKKIERLLFTTDGVLIREYLDEVTGDDLSLKFKVCNKEDLCREQVFEKMALNNQAESEKVSIDGAFISDAGFYGFELFISSANQIYPDASTGAFSITDLDAGSYDVYMNGDDANNGFYRYLYLKGVQFNKSTEIRLYAPLEENEEYDKPLLNCSYASSNQSPLFLLLLLMLFFIRPILNKKS